MVGWHLKFFVWLIHSWLFPPIRALLERNNRIPQTLAETDIPESPLFLPVHDCADYCTNAETSKLPAPSEMAAVALELPGTAVLHRMHVLIEHKQRQLASWLAAKLCWLHTLYTQHAQNICNLLPRVSRAWLHPTSCMLTQCHVTHCVTE